MNKKLGGAQIISLEIQFGSVEFNENFEDYNPDGVLSVRAKVLNFPMIEINENDFCDNCTVQETTFNKGKHLLIPIPAEHSKALQRAFVINIKVMKTSLPEDLLPVMEQIGFTSVNIARTFANLLSKVDPATNKQCPAIKLLSDQLEIIDIDTGSIIGTLNVYIRLKAFGKCIVTAMQDVLGNKSKIFDKCFDTKDVAYDDDMFEPGNENLTSIDNEFMELKALSPDIGLKVNVNKPVSDVHMPGNVKENKTLKPGTIRMGKDQMVFKTNQSDQPNQADDTSDNETGKSNKKVTYEMKTGRAPPADDQTLQMAPIPHLTPTLTQGPLTGQPAEETVDVYALSVTKKNAKKNTNASVQMEVRVPKSVKQVKERFNRDVQYLATDIAPPAPAGKKK